MSPECAIMALKPFPSLNLCVISLFFLLLQASTSSSASNETDLFSLTAIKDRIEGLGSWNRSLYFCQWQGVTCGKRHRRVVKLQLDHQNLVGSIAPHIGNLSFLRHVDLSLNKLSGRIPQEFGQLRRLEWFLLGGNAFEGNIPLNISQCPNLVCIDLTSNKFSGGVPVEVGSLDKLRYLFLELNQLTGQIPHSLGNLSSLQFLSLGDNMLTGSIPETLGSLSGLLWFIVQNNGLSGEVPPSLYNISSIRNFSVSSNQLTGTLPQDLFLTLPNLCLFYFSMNHLSGSLPSSLANASNVREFEVVQNNLTGGVPSNLQALSNLEIIKLQRNHLGRGQADDLSFITSLTNSTKLKTLDSSANNFGGAIPNSVSNLSAQIQMLYLDGNQISGIIPEGIGNLVNLIGLALEVNHLHGTIPSSIGNMQSLQQLTLWENELSGSIPSSLSSCAQLSKLDLAFNRLEGSIPISLGGFQHLTYLDLSGNNLNGSLPRQIFGISSLSLFLGLAHNSFTGSLPLEVGNLINLESLLLSGNKLSGEISCALATCLKLEKIDLGNNSLEGTIPGCLRALKGLTYIDLSSNKLVDKIPKYFEDFQFLESLNLSHNKLEGKVPMKGIFRNATAVSLTGNPRLCGGIHELQLDTCHTQQAKEEGSSVAFKLTIEIALSVFLLLALVFLFIYFKRKRQGETSSMLFRGQNFMVSYRTLYQATDGFSKANLIGLGSYGHVYKGMLNQYEMVAVKVFNLQQKGAKKSFMDECKSLSTTRHRNLVRILTCCASVDHQGNDSKALVFEFMPNGSLEKWLYGDTDGEVGQERKLNLLQRLNIASDVASALTYLHHESHVCIIHRDLKPNNVLLDSDMVAHVSDFGLAKLLSGSLENSSGKQSSSAPVKGSIGYIAPEYGMGGDASIAGDVYSFGILLLELFTARRPTDSMFTDGLKLRTFAEMALQNNVMEVVDPALSVMEEGPEAQRVQECIAAVLRIGVACSAEYPGGRMSMENVVKVLHHLKSNTFHLP